MKKNIKNYFKITVLLYVLWSCYTEFKHTGEHARNLMEWVGVAGKGAGELAKGMMK